MTETNEQALRALKGLVRRGYITPDEYIELAREKIPGSIETNEQVLSALQEFVRNGELTPDEYIERARRIPGSVWYKAERWLRAARALRARMGKRK